MKLPSLTNLPTMTREYGSSDDECNSVASSTSSTQVSEGSTAVTTRTIVAPHVGYKKVLVTGGAGFIGSHVAEALLLRGDDVVIVDEMNDYYDINIKKQNLKLLRDAFPEVHRLSVYIGDICDEELMLRIFETEDRKRSCRERVYGLV